MAIFYVLPSRVQVGQHFQEYLASMFPGQAWLASDWPDLAEALAQAAECQPGVYAVFADDLDETIGVHRSMMRDFGAEDGDEVIIVHPHRSPQVVQIDRRRIDMPMRRAA